MPVSGVGLHALPLGQIKVVLGRASRIVPVPPREPIGARGAASRARAAASRRRARRPATEQNDERAESATLPYPGDPSGLRLYRPSSGPPAPAPPEWARSQSGKTRPLKKVQIASWNRFKSEGLAVAPDVLGRTHHFDFEGKGVEVRLPGEEHLNRGEGYDTLVACTTWLKGHIPAYFSFA